MRSTLNGRPGGRLEIVVRALGVALVGVASTSAAWPALAEARPSDEADKARAERHKRDAFRAINHGDLERGLEKLEAAYAAFPHPTFLFNIAVVEEQRPNNCPAAFAAYQRFFRECDTCEARPLADSRFRRLEGRCLVPVRLTTDPPGARILIDGEPREGVTPLALRLWAGEHTVVAELEGHQRIERREVVLEARPADIELTLPPVERPGRIRLVGVPAGARARLDGEAIGEGEHRLEPGVHELEVMLVDGRTFTLYRNVRAGQVTTVDVAVEASGALSSRRPPSEAPVTIAASPGGRATWPIWTSLGVTVIAAGVGTGLGVAAADEADSVNANLALRPDLRAEQGDAAQAKATGANVAFAVAGVGAVATLAIWLWPELFGGSDEGEGGLAFAF